MPDVAKVENGAWRGEGAGMNLETWRGPTEYAENTEKEG